MARDELQVEQRGMANPYLHPVDRLMRMQGYRMVRYPDDFVVLTDDAKTAIKALAVVQRCLHERGRALNKQKTRIVPAGETLAFLGATMVAAGEGGTAADSSTSRTTKPFGQFREMNDLRH